MPLVESQSCCTNPSSVSQFLLQHDEGNVLWNLIPRLRVAYRTDEFIDFFYSYIGNPEFFSSYVGFFYGGIDAKNGERPLFTVFLFHSYVGIHNPPDNPGLTLPEIRPLSGLDPDRGLFAFRKVIS